MIFERAGRICALKNHYLFTTTPYSIEKSRILILFLYANTKKWVILQGLQNHFLIYMGTTC